MSDVDVESVMKDEVEAVVVDGIDDAIGSDAAGNDADGIDVDGIVAPPRNASMRAVREATPGNPW